MDEDVAGATAGQLFTPKSGLVVQCLKITTVFS